MSAVAAFLAAVLAIQQSAPAAPAASTAPSSRFVIVTQTPVAANPADVASIDAILRATYAVISGPAGQRRDWNRMRSLFTSNARMMPLGEAGLRSGSVEDYIATSGPTLETDGFFEQEIGRKIEQYGNIAHVFSTYQARRSEHGPVFMRGINSFQLARHGDRWWVVSIMWSRETPANPIPAEYLKQASGGERG